MENSSSLFSNASSFGDENLLLDHGETVDPTVAVVLTSITFPLAVVLLVTACCCCTDAQGGTYLGEKQRGAWGVFCSAFLFFVAAVLFLTYACELQLRDRQDYLGKMRVTGFSLHERTQKVKKTYGDGASTGWETYWYANLNIDWGYEWGCLESTLQCKASKYAACERLACNRQLCSEDEEGLARQAVRECALLIYNDTATYTPFDPLVGPSQDVDWPNLELYGDCDTCEVYGGVATKQGWKKLRLAGYVFLGVSVVWAVVLFVDRRHYFLVNDTGKVDKAVHFATPDDSEMHLPPVKEEPIVEEAPIVEETPIVQEAPIVQEELIVQEAPIVQEEPIIQEAPMERPVDGKKESPVNESSAHDKSEIDLSEQ